MLLRLAACNTSSPTNTTPPTSKQNNKSKTKSPLKTWQWKINHFFKRRYIIKWLNGWLSVILVYWRVLRPFSASPGQPPHLGRHDVASWTREAGVRFALGHPHLGTTNPSEWTSSKALVLRLMVQKCMPSSSSSRVQKSMPEKTQNSDPKITCYPQNQLGPCYRGVWMCLAGDLGSPVPTSLEIPMILREAAILDF